MSTPTSRAARARAAAERGPGQPPDGPQRRWLVPVVGLAVIVVVAVAVALLSSGDDDDVTAGGDDGDGVALATAAVTVRGDALPPLGDDADPAVGTVAPTLEGVAADGTPTTVEPTGEPTLLAFLAHWCPHCQAELPRLVDLAEEGALDGVRTVAVLTGTDEDLPNHPPGEWLVREGWAGEVLVDDDEQAAAEAYGLTSYPFLVLLDADGDVVARSAGELGEQGLRDFVAQPG